MLLVSCGDDDSPVDSGGGLSATIAVEPSSLNFDVDQTQLTLLLSNSGEGTLTWQCACDSNLVSYTPTTGSLTTGTDTIVVDANRVGLVGGEHSDTLMFTSNGGSLTVPVVVNVGLTPISDLIGDYSGVFSYTTNLGDATETTTQYAIRWRFSNTNYWMYDDSEGDPVLCEPSGTYVATTDNVELTQISSGCSYSVIDPAMTPVGEFTLRQPLDSVVLFQIDSENHIFRELRLVPATD
jgi:hypothetical protein